MKTDGALSVVQIIDALDVGGAEFVASTLADNLAKKGFDSHLVSTRNIGQMAKRVGPDVKIWCANRSGRFDISGLKRIADYIRSNNIKIVHSHSHTTGYIINLIRKFTNLKFIHVFQDHDPNVTGSKLYNFLDTIFLKGVNSYLSVSKELQNRAKNLLGLTDEKCLYINNSVVITNEPRKYQTGNTVIQVANIHARKGYTTAVRAASIICEQVPDLQWLCVGGFEGYPVKYIDELRSLIDELGVSENVKLIGPHSDIRKLLCQADVGVLTSHGEGLPIALLEYMAEGLPVVVTDVGDTGNIVRAAKSGLVCEPGDHKTIAQSILTQLTDTELAEKYGTNGKQFVKENHNMDVLIDEVANMYRSLIIPNTN